MSEPTLEEKMAALQARFKGQLQERYQTIATPWQDFINNSNLNLLADVHMAVHKMAGSAATFGFTDISKLAKDAELALDPTIQQGVELDQESIDLISNKLSAMDKLINES
jgi:chemotaxis protein histidine kinase CheA